MQLQGLFYLTTDIHLGDLIITDRDIAVTSELFTPSLPTTSKSKTSLWFTLGALGSTNEYTNEYFNTETYRIFLKLGNPIRCYRRERGTAESHDRIRGNRSHAYLATANGMKPAVTEDVGYENFSKI